ncbi:MAG: transglycosylase domain-containing protein [Alphaproteobacteria bacterium]
MWLKLRRNLKKIVLTAAGVVLAAAAVVYTFVGELPESFDRLTARADKVQFLDRSGVPLNTSYLNYWNAHDTLRLYEMPPLLIQMFLAAEDRNFYSHAGVDWTARAAALFQNIKAGKIVRGASSLSEQVVRMIIPRPRTVFSKIIEGIDAVRLERRFSKNDILEFYLNQVPYAANRRGVKQAALFYFSKTPDRLSVRETAALVVLVRAPSSFDLYADPDKINGLIDRQLRAFQRQGIISETELQAALNEKIRLSAPELSVSAPHFLEYVRSLDLPAGRAVETTLDAFLQKKVAALTRRRLKDLQYRHVSNAAVVVIERATGNILAWVVESSDKDTAAVNAVLTPRQPASAQKPLLYALALTKGMTAATEIKDAPFSRAVGSGVHHFKNYSRAYYGDVTLRQALGNSLNIPALKTIEFVGIKTYFDFLRQIGFSHFEKNADFYREGLALGNAEVTLPELSRAYLMLANGGILKPLRAFKGQECETEKRVLPETAATLIGNILSDPLARQLEFGADSILNFPVQTAVKTGTSTDYRDAWAMGYNADFVAGVWLGNLTYEPMLDVTGASGPALLLRSVFTELNKIKNSGPLYLSARLEKKTDGEKTEYFDPDIVETSFFEPETPVILSPADGVMLAVDPRVPEQYQQYPFSVSFLPEGARIVWVVDENPSAPLKNDTFFWRPEKGSHTVRAEITLKNGEKILLSERRLTVR